MSVLTYTDSFVRANVAKLSLDSARWVGITDGKCLSIRSNKLLTTWQDILDGYHNTDIALCAPTSFPSADESIYSEAQSGSLTFSASTRVSKGETSAPATYTDNFNRADSASNAVGAAWALQAASGTDAFDIRSNKLRLTSLGTGRSMIRYILPGDIVNQYSQAEYRALSHGHDDSWGLNLRFGLSVRATGDLEASLSYDLIIVSQISTSHVYEIRVGNASTGSSLQSGALPGLLTAGDIFKLTAEETATGVDLKAWRNGVQMGATVSVPALILGVSNPNYIAAGQPAITMPVYTGVDSGYMDIDNWEGGAIVGAVESSTQISTEIGFYSGGYGVGYSEDEDAPGADTYTPKVYVFTDTDYQEAAVTLVNGDILSGEVEIVDLSTCNVVVKVNAVEVARIDGAPRTFGRALLRGVGSSPEQITYVDGLQPRSEQVWSSATLTVEIVTPAANETDRTAIATCVRTKDKAAWGKWKFSGTLRAYSVMDNLLVLSIERGDTVFVETIDISPVPGTRFLDCEVLSADLAAPVYATGITEWTLPFEITEDPDHPLTIVRLSDGTRITSLARTFAAKISATGNFTAVPVAIGLRYPAQWELTPLYVTTQEEAGETVALTDGRLQIRHVEFNFNATGEFSVTVIPNTDDESQEYEYTYTGASDAEKGTYRVPVLGQNTKARITVGGTSHRPFAISNFSWTGYLSQITKRV